MLPSGTSAAVCGTWRDSTAYLGFDLGTTCSGRHLLQTSCSAGAEKRLQLVQIVIHCLLKMVVDMRVERHETAWDFAVVPVRNWPLVKAVLQGVHALVVQRRFVKEEPEVWKFLRHAGGHGAQ